MEKLDIEARREKAMALFTEGYNCSQAIVKTFADITGADNDKLVSLAASFGGGMGRLREVCGAVSGMFMVCGLLYGYSTPEKGEKKAELYAKVQKLGLEFEHRHSSIICRDLLGLNVNHDEHVPAERTPEYYASRPCPMLIGDAAAILAEFINENPV